MNVLILAKTRMREGFCCVGGLDLETNRGVRLLQANGLNQPESTPYQIGQIWALDARPADLLRPPHIEDVLVSSARGIGRQIGLASFLRDRVEIWRGSPNVLFDGLLKATPLGSGYISAKHGMPPVSVGFWISDRELSSVNSNGKWRYNYSGRSPVRYIPYVGMERAIPRLKAGTLLRVSLARWWSPPGKSEIEERCYLQLSGWYQD